VSGKKSPARTFAPHALAAAAATTPARRSSRAPPNGWRA
jgi:hypothetical protein